MKLPPDVVIPAHAGIWSTLKRKRQHRPARHEAIARELQGADVCVRLAAFLDCDQRRGPKAALACRHD
jgi:hypothetical protein